MRLGSWSIETHVGAKTPTGVLAAEQIHCGRIARVTELPVAADGIVVTPKDPAVAIRTADCLPIVLLSERVALLLHVSRKTLVEGLLDVAPTFLPPATITNAYIGAHICPEHFSFETFGPEIKAFAKKFPAAVTRQGEVVHLSLDIALDHYLKSWGVSESVIKRDKRCTFEDASLPSYRRRLQSGEPYARIDTIVRFSA